MPWFEVDFAMTWFEVDFATLRPSDGKVPLARNALDL